MRGYRSKAFGGTIPWPVLVLIAIPAVVVVAVGGYLIVRLPEPYVLPIPAVVAAVIAFAHVAERRPWGRSPRAGVAVYCVLQGYVLVAAAWGAIGLTAAIVVLALWLPWSVVVIRKGALARRIVVWDRAREPGDTRTTSPF
jgi:uncharacterized membrane protein YfcA